MAEKTTARPKISPVAQQIATELGETTPGPAKQIDIIVRLLGAERALAILAHAQEVEANGGLLLPDGSRRHTFGGVFFRLVREQATPEQRATIFLPKNKRTPKGAKPTSAPAAPPAAG
jgi:hypothetical protein